MLEPIRWPTQARKRSELFQFSSQMSPDIRTVVGRTWINVPTATRQSNSAEVTSRYQDYCQRKGSYEQNCKGESSLKPSRARRPPIKKATSNGATSAVDSEKSSPKTDKTMTRKTTVIQD